MLTMAKPRLVRREYFRDQGRYWAMLEAHRDARSELPSWAFDFVSVHNVGGEFTLLAPLCIVGSARPRWERKRWPSEVDAVLAARRIARHHRLHVVNCVLREDHA